MDFVRRLHEIMQNNKIMLVYEGEFTQEITKSVLLMTEKNLDNMKEEGATKRKVFNVMVECLQNIVRHSEDRTKQDKTAVFFIGIKEGEYFICTGNLVDSENVPVLQAKLEQINSLDKDGLKQLQKELISSGTLNERGGAGLGLIDIARKSGKKLDYNFDKIDDNQHFYSLYISIPRNTD
jgi:hypothetical protein